jgi:hypothetical protein
MTVIIAGTEYLTIAEVARRLCTTETRTLMLMKKRALTGELIEGEWYITAVSLAELDLKGDEPPTPSCKSTCTSSGCGCH